MIERESRHGTETATEFKLKKECIEMYAEPSICLSATACLHGKRVKLNDESGSRTHRNSLD
jgi:hypothetical protein